MQYCFKGNKYICGIFSFLSVVSFEKYKHTCAVRFEKEKKKNKYIIIFFLPLDIYIILLQIQTLENKALFPMEITNKKKEQKGDEKDVFHWMGNKQPKDINIIPNIAIE